MTIGQVLRSLLKNHGIWERLWGFLDIAWQRILPQSLKKKERKEQREGGKEGKGKDM